MAKEEGNISLGDFTRRQFSDGDGGLPALIQDISEVAKRIADEAGRAALDGKLGAEGRVNVQGEEVQKMDQYANEIFINALRTGGHCAGLVSEETEQAVIFNDEANNNSGYVVLIDPIDGSENIDLNMSIGSIFSVYPRVSGRGKPAKPEDFLQPGENLVVAGYIIYSTSTMLVYATGAGVNGFTLDRSANDFFLTHPQIRIPPRGRYYSFDNSYYNRVDPGLKRYVDFCMSVKDNKNGPYSNRYYGCLVADMHRNLLKGGIYFYSQVEGKPNGKLRLCYECNPMAFIAEAAGGAATNGKKRILELSPAHIHQRSPFFVGSREMMEELMDALA